MDDTQRQQKLTEIAELRQRIVRLEDELETAAGSPPRVWERRPEEYYPAYQAWSGAILGSFAAIVSLLFNVIGSSIAGLHPLRLIQIYLTFPLGDGALSDDLDTGMALAVGCCLYLGTGMLLGIPVNMLMARFMPGAPLVKRLAFASVLGLLLWAINFYLILSWLQPMLFDGGYWITDPTLLPPWVGAATHLVFAWTIAILYPWGVFQPDERARGIASSDLAS